MIALIVRASIVRYKYYEISFRYINVMESTFFFAYKNVTQSVWLFVYINVMESAFFLDIKCNEK